MVRSAFSEGFLTLSIHEDALLGLSHLASFPLTYPIICATHNITAVLKAAAKNPTVLVGWLQTLAIIKTSYCSCTVNLAWLQCIREQQWFKYFNWYFCFVQFGMVFPNPITYM